MQEKRIHFLSSLPRAGNTILGSILNQNPNIGTTPNSVVTDIARSLYTVKQQETFQNFPNNSSFDNICSSIFDNYYKDWNYKHIIDRGPWGFPTNFKFLKKHFNQEIKIIVLVRDVLEILSSYIKWSNENKNAFVNQYEANTVEEKCHMLMNKEGYIMNELVGVHHLTQITENKHYVHLIEYDDLIYHSENTINSIYDFLGIESFKHNFEKFNQFTVQNMFYEDSKVLGDNLHTVKENGLTKTVYDFELPTSIVEKYGSLNFWRK